MPLADALAKRILSHLSRTERAFISYSACMHDRRKTGLAWAATACVTVGLLTFYILPRLWINRGVPPFIPLLVLCFIETPTWFHARPQFVWWLRRTPSSDSLLRHWSISDDLIGQSRLPNWIIQSTVKSRAGRCLLMSRLYRNRRQSDLALESAKRGLKLMPQSQALLRELVLCGQSL